MAWAMTILALASAGIALDAAPAAAAVASISTAALPPVYSASTTYTLTVNGVSVPVNGYAGYDYAQFSMGAGTARIAVTKLNGTNVGAAHVSPMKLGYRPTLHRGTATFTIPEPEYLIVKLDGQRRLVIAADPAETDKPASSGTGIFNVTSSKYSADATGKTVTTAAVQAALDDASMYGTRPLSPRGIVYIPSGVYFVGNLELRSNTAVYLEAGTVLRVAPDKSLYTVDAHKTSQNRDLTWWIQTEFNSTNIKMYGRGTLDGNGMAATRAGFGMNVVVPIATTNFTFDGLTVRESASWSVIPVRSNDLRFTNIKLFNRFDMGEVDGLDIIESQNVTATRGLGIGLDDPFTTKSYRVNAGDILMNWPGTPEKVQNVTFDGMMSWTYCYGFKVGQGVGTDQTNVTFKNGVVYDSAVALGVHHKAYTAAVDTVTFDNIDIERVTNTNDGNRTWLAVMINDQTNEGAGPVSNVTVSRINIRDRGTTAAKLTGFSATSAIRGVTFDSIRMPGSSGYATTMAEMNVTDRRYVTGVTIRPVQNPEP
jgi:hypothetical protein